VSRRVAVGCFLALAGCGPKTIDLALNIVTNVCEPAVDPFEGVNFVQVRVSGPALEAPIISTQIRSAATLQIPEIPAGPSTVIEVRGYAQDPNQVSTRPISIGRSLPFTVPDVVTATNQSVEINVFLRKVDAFTPPSPASAPGACSPMRQRRAGHTATLLEDGRVFIVGGYDLNASKVRSALVETEFFNPNTGAFEDGPKLALTGGTVLPTAMHTATRLKNGQVLIVGGEQYSSNKPSPRGLQLVYDPSTNLFGSVPARTTNPTVVPRSRHMALMDQGGRVLVLGGISNQVSDAGMALPPPTPHVEWFNPETSRMEYVSGETFARSDASGAAVRGGEYLIVAGGVDGSGALSDQVVSFKFQNDTFVRGNTLPPLTLKRRSAAAVTLNDDSTVLLMGGYSDPTAVVPMDTSEVVKTSSSVVDDGPLVGPRGDLCAAVLQQGSVLAVGGRKVDGAVMKSDESATLIRFDARTGTLSSAGASPLKFARWAHTCTTLSDGSVLVTGGINETTNGPDVLGDAWIYTPIPGE
jgi:hypothetical protein